MAAVASQDCFFSSSMGNHYLKISLNEGSGAGGNSALESIKAVAGMYFGNIKNTQGKPIFSIKQDARNVTISSSGDSKGSGILRYVHGCIPATTATLEDVKRGLSMAEKA